MFFAFIDQFSTDLAFRNHINSKLFGTENPTQHWQDNCCAVLCHPRFNPNPEDKKFENYLDMEHQRRKGVRNRKILQHRTLHLTQSQCPNHKFQTRPKITSVGFPIWNSREEKITMRIQRPHGETEIVQFFVDQSNEYVFHSKPLGENHEFLTLKVL
jgi:hypothetical protein